MRSYIYLFFILFSGLALAQDNTFQQDDFFQYKDWAVACDNTLTCRAVGSYDQGKNGNVYARMALLLERKAGANKPLSGQVKIDDQMPGETLLSLAINDKSLGPLKWKEDNLYELSKFQLTQLIEALKGDKNTIFFYMAHKKWFLSDAGFNAAMLKMDEKQGRIGTTGAIISSGDKDESQVYRPTLMPIIKAATDVGDKPIKNVTFSEINKLFPEFKKRYANEEKINCNGANSSNNLDKDFANKNLPLPELITLTDEYNLLKVFCDIGQPTSNLYSFWVIPNVNTPNDNDIKLVTKTANDYYYGIITSDNLQQVIYNDHSFFINIAKQWIWTGESFVLQSEIAQSLRDNASTWSLPIFVSKIKS